MTIQEQIKDSLKQAMLNKNTEMKNILRVVLAEFSRDGKELTDEQALKEITKLAKNTKEIIKNSVGDAKDIAIIELEILNRYLPQQMSEEELTEKIQNFINFNQISTMKEMGKIMGYLSGKFKGKYDGRMASNIVKGLLS